MDPNCIGKTEKKDDRPHAVMVPFPTQGHVNPMMKLGKLLHRRGFHVTFVNSEHNHRRLLRSRGPSALDGSSSFRFAAIPVGLPFSDATQDIHSLILSAQSTCLAPFKDLLARLCNDDQVPSVSCIVWDSLMLFAIVAAEELGIADVLFWAGSAAGFLSLLYIPTLVNNGFVPFKDESCLEKEYLDTTVVDWIPGMEGARLKDLSIFIRTTDPNDPIINHIITTFKLYHRASALVLNTFDALEHQCVSSISSLLGCPVYSIGPLDLLVTQTREDDNLKTIGSNLWAEESDCLGWLDAKEPNSVLYVNFGSIQVMTRGQVAEIAWGLASSGVTFLWVVRPDMVAGDSADHIVPPEFLTVVGERGKLASWCNQVEVLNHQAVGGFLMHSGWNSMIESICAGVPVICMAFVAEQHQNRRFSCVEWGIGEEIEEEGEREEVERAVREVMEGERGKEMKKKVLEWKEVAHHATEQGGSSQLDFDKLVSRLTKNTSLHK